MPNVGYATIQIIPSVRGIDAELRRQLVGPAGDAGGDAGQAAGGGLKDKLKLGAAAAGAAAGALLVAGIAKAVDRANITSTLQAQLGTSNKVAAEQGKIAGKLYGKGIGETFQDAADAIKATVQAGLAPPGTTNKQLESIATKAANVAQVFDQDLGGVTNAVSQMLRTGLAKNATEAFDIITKGFQSGANKADDLLDTVNEYGTQFRKAGLTGADAIGLINQAIKGGARDADLAADAIKEFGIRAVDGSASSAQGFNDLGLSGKKMAAGFAKGGAAANSVLDITLDRLRAVKDPVKQSRIAVALFGTQAEDLGKALFAMDPSSAAKGLGQIGGAAKKVGDTIHSGPSHEIEVFKRALEQGFVDFIGAKVLPIVVRLAAGFNTHLLPPIRAVASSAAAVLLPALAGIWKAGAAVVQWLKDMNTWLIPIGIAIVGLTIAMNTQAIATAAVTAVFSIYRAAMLVGAAVTNGFAGAQALLNAVMAANPIVLIVTLIIALGAALVIAYQKSETFRSIVQAAWAGIQTAALWAWTNVLKPVFDGLVTAFRAVAAVATWLWTTILSPVFSALSLAARILLTVVVTLVLLPIIVTFKILAAVATWLWKTILAPAFKGIGAIAMWLWNAMLKPAFNNVIAVFRVVASVATWLWQNVAVPVFRGIGAAISLWWTGVRIIFNAVRSFITGPLATVFRWLWKNVIGPAWNGIKAAISIAWTTGIRPVFDKVKAAVGLVGKAFDTARAAIKIAWDKIKGIARGPVQYVVDVVYNNGIRGVWNKVAGAFGAPKLGAYKFATGGVLPGYTPGRDVHLAALSGGEAVMRPEWTRAVGPGYVNAMNAAARQGGVRGVQQHLGLPGFADGGIFGWVKGAASKTLDLAESGISWLKDGLKESAIAGMNQIVRPLIRKISGSASMYRDMVTGIPKRMLNAIFDFSGKADTKLAAAGIGGKGYKTALSWARTQSGKPYQWGGNGDPSWDCSGFLSAIESVIRGQRPHRRWATGAFSGRTAPAGWVHGGRSPYMVGITNAGVGHTAGTINGVNVESRGGSGVLVGKRARSYHDPLFTDVYALKYDGGGWLQPGVTAAVNATRQPEAILTASQWKVAQAALVGTMPGSGLGDITVHVYVGDREITDIARAEVRTANGQLLTALHAGRKG